MGRTNSDATTVIPVLREDGTVYFEYTGKTINARLFDWAWDSCGSSSLPSPSARSSGSDLAPGLGRVEKYELRHQTWRSSSCSRSNHSPGARRSR